jgi:HAD superfamily hydrolase (TIGR01490 family)
MLTPVLEAAFFDLDKTVIAKASMVAFGGPFYRHGLITRRLLLRGLWGQLVYLYLGADEERLARMRESVLTLTKGWEQVQVRRIVREALTDVVTPIIYAEALELIEEHRVAGRRVFIVSASPEEIVQPLAEHLDADEAIASRARIDDEGRYTGEMEFYAYGVNKAKAMEEVALREGIDLTASWAYSDSATDIPMLDAVGHPVVVNPDRELARVARERGWEIRKFERPVRLRDRVPTPPPAPTAVGASALVAGAVAALWWKRRHPPPPPARLAEVRRLAASLPRLRRVR